MANNKLGGHNQLVVDDLPSLGYLPVVRLSVCKHMGIDPVH